MVQGISQRNTTRGIEIGQGFGHDSENQPQIEIVATNVEIHIGYPINPGIGPEEIPNNTNHNIPMTEPPRVEQPRAKQPITEPPRVEPPRFEQPRTEPPRVEPPQFKQPRMEPPRVEPPRFEPPRVEPTRFEQPRMEPPGLEPPRLDNLNSNILEWNHSSKE